MEIYHIKGGNIQLNPIVAAGTRVEIIAVAIMLVLPQFSSCATDARVSPLSDQMNVAATPACMAPAITTKTPTAAHVLLDTLEPTVNRTLVSLLCSEK